MAENLSIEASPYKAKRAFGSFNTYNNNNNIHDDDDEEKNNPILNDTIWPSLYIVQFMLHNDPHVNVESL